MVWFAPFLVQLLIGVALQVIGYLLLPKPKSTRSEEVADMENPTAEGGRPIPVVFGEHEVEGVNIIFFGEKRTVSRMVKM